MDCTRRMREAAVGLCGRDSSWFSSVRQFVNETIQVVLITNMASMRMFDVESDNLTQA